jgi:hypothetical protein
MGRADDTYGLIPIITEEIRKRATKGDNPIYLKSGHIVEDNEEYIKLNIPELHKKGKVYEKQLVTATLRKLGFYRKATNYHNSVLTLKY